MACPESASCTTTNAAISTNTACRDFRSCAASPRRCSRRESRLVCEAFGAPIDDTFLRLEYAQDVDGFWLQPHTDLGVKKFTCLIYLSDGAGHETLGTDIYETPERHFSVSPFKRGGAMAFVPGDNTWHGFEKRRIEGVRRSVILNYVTHEWRDRGQLSYPDRPVRV
jgi:hypothetical protein